MRRLYRKSGGGGAFDWPLLRACPPGWSGYPALPLRLSPGSPDGRRRGRLLRGLVLGSLLLLAGYLGFRRSVKVRRSALFRPAEDGVAAGESLTRKVWFRSTDGLLLSAWWRPGSDARRAVILVHGRGDSKSSPYVLEAARIYAKAGFGVLALDLRGRGESEGRFSTAGYQEVRDVRGALSWLAEQGFEPEDVVLHGWSMGAATVLRAAPGTGIAAVVSESGYADLPLLLGNLLPGNHGSSPLLNSAAFFTARLLGVSFDPWSLRPTEEAARLREEGKPLFVIHSVDDYVVPFEHAELLTAAHTKAGLWKPEGCGHAAAYTSPEYERRLLAFLDEATESQGDGPVLQKGSG